MRISKDKITISVVGAGSRSTGYLNALEKYYAGQFEVVAVADPDKARRDYYKERFSIPDENIFLGYEEFDRVDRLSDVVIIGTLDDIHFDPAISALEKGYDLILEKPISMNLEESVEVGKVAEKYPNQMVAVCHVLRHSPFFRTLKEIIDSGELGKVVDIQHNENIGYYHFAHSYVRGNWRNTKIAAPISVAKTCHDFDILLYLLGNDIHYEYISSMGSLTYFTNKNFDPEKMAKRCVDCKIESTCPYSALKIYTSQKIRSVVFDTTSSDRFINSLDELGYGRCVFACDNDVCDNQVTVMQFTGGIHATFNMSAFSDTIHRSIKIMCERGEIRGHEKLGVIEITPFGEAPRTIQLERSAGGHNGADEGFVQNFMESYLNGKEFDSSISESIESHVAAFAAEESRLQNGKNIHIPTYWDNKKQQTNK